MAADYNIPCWTALQTNRQGFDTEFVHTQQMGGSIKRAQKTHFLMSIGRTPDQKEAGLANLQILKARFAQDGQQFKDCIFNNGTMEIRVTDTVRSINLEAKGEKSVDADNLNASLRKIEEKTSIKDVPKEEIVFDMDSKDVLEKLIGKKSEEKKHDDFKNFLDQKAGSKGVSENDENK